MEDYSGLFSLTKSQIDKIASEAQDIDSFTGLFSQYVPSITVKPAVYVAYILYEGFSLTSVAKLMFNGNRERVSQNVKNWLDNYVKDLSIHNKYRIISKLKEIGIVPTNDIEFRVNLFRYSHDSITCSFDFNLKDICMSTPKTTMFCGLLDKYSSSVRVLLKNVEALPINNLMNTVKFKGETYIECSNSLFNVSFANLETGCIADRHTCKKIQAKLSLI